MNPASGAGLLREDAHARVPATTVLFFPLTKTCSKFVTCAAYCAAPHLKILAGFFVLQSIGILRGLHVETNDKASA
jgi:hypothetical protein